MSKTKRYKIKGKYNHLRRQQDRKQDKMIQKLKAKGLSWWKAYDEAKRLIPSAWDLLSDKEKRIIETDYSKSPSWWNRLFNNAPKKRQTRDMLKKIDLKTECDDLVFPDDNKPHLYYW